MSLSCRCNESTQTASAITAAPMMSQYIVCSVKRVSINERLLLTDDARDGVFLVGAFFGVVFFGAAFFGVAFRAVVFFAGIITLYLCTYAKEYAKEYPKLQTLKLTTTYNCDKVLDMHDNPNVYKLFPYGEVQRQLSDETVARLAAIISAVQEPAIDDTVSEVVVATSEHEWRHGITTRMEAFTSMIPDINPVLVEHQHMPEYLKDTLCAMIKSVQDAPDMLLRAQTGVLQDIDMSDYMRTVWASTEPERLTGEVVVLYRSGTSKGGTTGVVLRKAQDDTWALGMTYEERRSYELHGTGYLYRIVDSQLFTDPVGSEGDATNIQDGLYLPSMLELPNMRTSVTV